MAKRKKTRKEKILADQRKKSFNFTLKNTSAIMPVVKEIVPEISSPSNTQELNLPTVNASGPSIKQSVSTTNYHYLSHDLKKIALLTGAIVIVEIVVRLFVKI